VLASLHERYKKLIAGHPDAKKEMYLVRASIVQIEQLVQNPSIVNGNGAKWKETELKPTGIPSASLWMDRSC
jgi:hypothetical protein